jgi:hypothetical protein
VTGRLTPANRAALIATAKRAATPVASCVAASIPPAHILGKMTRAELSALVIVLAEAVDHARLREVIAAGDDGTPAVRVAAAAPEGTTAERLRRAHTEASRLRRAGLAVPNQVRRDDNAYHEALKAAREAAVVTPGPQAEGAAA